ncbi:hypothetical protein B0H10DRAFT_2221107 [Mycena sp. CBHHK59/15]|nr:hypothetical protein B0H10DRAFT_2221107 [Mycena sp. CBHHK59/15]
MSRLVAFIIGAGANIGQHTAAALKLKATSRRTKSPEHKAAFATITAEVGPPSVVIFNEPLTLSLESLTQQTALGLAVFAAAQEALSGFRSDALKDMPRHSSPPKVVQWRLVELLAHAYSKENIRCFYFATLVDKTGGLLVPLSAFFTSGPQHAQVYLDLITKKEQVDWDFRFTLDAQQWKKA